MKLPLGFPERWNYWLTPAKGRGGSGDRWRIEQTQRIQFSFRPRTAGPVEETDSWVDVARIEMVF